MDGEGQRGGRSLAGGLQDTQSLGNVSRGFCLGGEGG